MSRTETLASVRKDAPSLSVAILTANLLALGSEIRLLEQARTKLIHVDVMDGHFCPQLTVGPAFVRAIRTSALKDVHLMIEKPLGTLEGFVAAGGRPHHSPHRIHSAHPPRPTRDRNCDERE